MNTWHAPAEALVRFATDPEGLDEPAASSLEQHLVGCPSCRAVVAESIARGDRAALDASWASVADVIDRSRMSAAERLLRALGVAPGTARLVVSTRQLRMAWAASVIGVSTVAAALAQHQGSDGPFLALAPLVPLAAVLLAFSPVADPAGEAGAATPVHGLGLALRRALAVVLPSLAVLALVSAFLPDTASRGAAWMLPGLALAAGALALSTYVRVPVAAGALAGLWIVLLVVLAGPAARRGIDQVVLFREPGQLAALVMLVCALVVILRRRARFARLEVPW